MKKYYKDEKIKAFIILNESRKSQNENTNT